MTCKREFVRLLVAILRELKYLFFFFFFLPRKKYQTYSVKVIRTNSIFIFQKSIFIRTGIPEVKFHATRRNIFANTLVRTIELILEEREIRQHFIEHVLLRLVM